MGGVQHNSICTATYSCQTVIVSGVVAQHPEFICLMCFYVATDMSNIFFIAFSFCSKVLFLWTLVVRTTATPFLGSSDRLRGNVRAPVRLVFLNEGTHSRFCSFLIKWNLQYSRRKLLGMRNSKHTFMGQSSNLLSYSSKMSVINMFSNFNIFARQKIIFGVSNL